MPRHERIAFCNRLVVIIGLLGFALNPVPTNGQRQESFEGFMYGIRANAVTGKVLYHRKDGTFILEGGLRMEQGDLIKSGDDSYTELLLQPGNYLRVSGKSECQILSDQHDKIKLWLGYGTISLELLSREHLTSFYNQLEAYELIRVITPNAIVFIRRPGIYRIDASTGKTELTVRDGEAWVNGWQVKKKRRAEASREGVERTEIDSKIEDGFDVWGRERADKLVQANKLLKNEAPWAKKRKEGLETSVDLPEEMAHNSPYVVSAIPGTVNFVEDGVEFSQQSKEWQELTEKSQLETGDKVRTNEISFAELILFPDMHLRLDNSSEILFEQLSNDSISLKVLRGSAILDVARFDRKRIPQITIAGPSTSAVIADDGNYRIDARSDGGAITVRDGKVVFNEQLVGGCRKIAGGTISECEQKRVGIFDFWSQYRGEGELYYGRSRVSTVTYLTRLRRLRFRNTGFWFQNPGQTYYTFVPFTSTRFRSPYGGSYSTVLTPRRMTIPRIYLSGMPSTQFMRPQFARPPLP
jgi:hypothetical protein